MSIYYVLTFIFIGKSESLRFGFGTAFCGTSVPLILFIERCIFFFCPDAFNGNYRKKLSGTGSFSFIYGLVVLEYGKIDHSGS